MDLQGAELLAFEGASDILDKVKVIHLEVGFRQMYEGQVLFWDIDKYLSDRFFEKISIDLGRWPKILPFYRIFKTGPWVTNAIYANKR